MGQKRCLKSHQEDADMIRRKLISSTVEALLNELEIENPLVDVKEIAEKKGALVVEEPLKDEDFSGFLYRSSDSPPVIGVNSLHHPNRKRFTIAHELGHMLLHPKTGVHLDKVMIQMRDSKSAEGSDHDEIEANRFAAELLMPAAFLERDIRSMGKIHADDETAIDSLAKRYGVSKQSMAIRLSGIGLVWM